MNEMNVSTDLFNLRDHILVVTGGTGVLGGAMARAAATCGARVVLIGRTEKKAEAAARILRESGADAVGLAADVTDEQSLEHAASEVIAKYGRIDGLVNAAGGNRPDATVSEDRSFFDITADAMHDVMRLNWTGTVSACRAFGRAMAASGRGSIVNISSLAADRPLTRVGGYSAAKAAVDNFTRWLAVEMARHFTPNLRVNAIAPGIFLTEQNRFLLQEEDGALTERGRRFIEHTPMGRFGDPDDLGGALIWLLSEASRYVTGIVVPVDGGFTAYSGV